ncbi:hypothetical protein SEA_RUBYRALPH_83 [Microbacterium phage RubyRalph]|nr:hypothetical protein SEA_RUBYRALPH_83 [Microbacterium phage RubyRalph]
MTENIAQTSASERRAHALKVLTEHGARDAQPDDPGSVAQLTLALRSLLEAPGIGMPELVRDFEQRITEQGWISVLGQEVTYSEKPHARIIEGYRLGLVDGEQYAHERWEPADRPSQEQMLRWLGIEFEEYDDAGPMLSIPQQYIEKEAI